MDRHGGLLVDLNPAGAAFSLAIGASGTQQVGFARIDNITRAGLWSGTAGSWVDLNPTGSNDSIANGTSGTQQVGFAAIGNGVPRASLWSGTAGSSDDLSITLTGSWRSSFARSIWNDATTLYVAGYGRNNAAGRDEALLWTRPLVSACGLSDIAGPGPTVRPDGELTAS